MLIHLKDQGTEKKVSTGMRASRVQVGKETSTKRELIRDTAIEAQENLGQKAHKTRGNKSKKQK